MPLSNIEPKKTVTVLTNSEYSIDPDLLDILKGFFESKGFNSVTSDILATNMITSAIDAGNVTTTSTKDLYSKISRTSNMGTTVPTGGSTSWEKPQAKEGFDITKPNSGLPVEKPLTPPVATNANRNALRAIVSRDNL